MDRESPIFNQNIAIYPSIATFGTLVARLDPASNPSTHLQATVLMDLCCSISRDLAYLDRLMEDVGAALKGAASYHTQWASEVRKTATGSLNQVNSYIASKIPGTAQPLFKAQDPSKFASKLKVSDAMKDITSVAALQQQLVAAHAGLVSAMGLMHRLAIQRDGLVGNQEERRMS
ncbi:hypothetical protein PG984_012082 [Apiospora sp. TS-2023a]